MLSTRGKRNKNAKEAVLSFLRKRFPKRIRLQNRKDTLVKTEGSGKVKKRKSRKAGRPSYQEIEENVYRTVSFKCTKCDHETSYRVLKCIICGSPVKRYVRKTHRDGSLIISESEVTHHA